MKRICNTMLYNTLIKYNNKNIINVILAGKSENSIKIVPNNTKIG